MDLKINDPETVEYDGIALDNIRKQQVYVFHKDQSRIKLKISPTFAFIAVNNTAYSDTLSYCNNLIEVIKIIKEKTPYFHGKRFGLRKINQCVLMDISKLNNYFEEKHYHIYKYSDSTRLKVNQLKDNLYIDDYNINLTRTIVNGEIGETEAYQITFDEDIYITESADILELICENKHIREMNNLLFELYKDVLTDEFLKQLTDGSYEESIIRGINQNV